MQSRNKVLVLLVIISLSVFFPKTLLADLGSLSLSKDTAYLSGDTIVASVVDKDRDTTSAQDTLTTALKVVGANFDASGASGDLTMNLVENGVNTGTFLATITTGVSTSGGGTNSNIGTIKAIQDGILTVVYTDAAPSASSATKQLALSAFNAAMVFDADSYPLGAFALITLADAERNTVHTSAQSLLSDVFIQTSASNSTKVRMAETGADTGTFLGSIKVASSGGTSEFSQIQAAEGDTLRITYVDSVNTTGSSRTVTDTALVITAQSPTITTGSATNITYNSATLNGIINAQGLSTTAWFEYGTTNGSYNNITSTQNITGSIDTAISVNISGLSANTTYYYRIVAQNSVGISYGNEISFTTLADTGIPTGSITINSNASYTNSIIVTLSLSATDDTEVTGYYISTNSTIPSASDSGWTLVTSATIYTGNISYTLSSDDGNKTVYALYKDTSGNISSTASDSIILDTTAPTVIITSPTSNSIYTTSNSTIALGGNASDTTSGVSNVTWSNDKGGGGTANGTASWLTPSIGLMLGENTIIVTVTDGAGNTETDTITVTYNTGSEPTVTTEPATNISSTSATLNGTVNSNGLITMVWFQYGITSGSYNTSSSSQSVSGSNNTTVSIDISGLSAGVTYFYRIVAQNTAGTSYGNELSFTTSDTNAPTGTLNINEGAAYTRSATVTLTLYATDNTGVTGYYFSTNSTTPSASASGWTSISSTAIYSGNVSYTLSSGDGKKTVYVWYKDNLGNVSSAASDSIILDTHAPTITITSPTFNSTYTTTNGTIALGGTVSDSTSGVSNVTWSNDKGGSGTANGTISWLTPSIDLMLGENTITVTATDGAGNIGIDSITITFPNPTATPMTTSSLTPTPIATPSQSPTQSPTNSPTPTPMVCTPDSINADPSELTLQGKQSNEVTITLSGKNGCPVAGELVKSKINATGKKCISVSPESQTTDANGQVAFTITAKNKTGKANIFFKARDLKAKVKVKVVK